MIFHEAERMRRENKNIVCVCVREKERRVVINMFFSTSGLVSNL